MALSILRYKYLLEEIQYKYANNQHIFITMDHLSFSSLGYTVFLVLNIFSTLILLVFFLFLGWTVQANKPCGSNGHSLLFEWKSDTQRFR